MTCTCRRSMFCNLVRPCFSRPGELNADAPARRPHPKATFICYTLLCFCVPTCCSRHTPRRHWVVQRGSLPSAGVPLSSARPSVVRCQWQGRNTAARCISERPQRQNPCWHPVGCGRNPMDGRPVGGGRPPMVSSRPRGAVAGHRITATRGIATVHGPASPPRTAPAQWIGAAHGITPGHGIAAGRGIAATQGPWRRRSP